MFFPTSLKKKKKDYFGGERAGFQRAGLHALETERGVLAEDPAPARSWAPWQSRGGSAAFVLGGKRQVLTECVLAVCRTKSGSVWKQGC